MLRPFGPEGGPGRAWRAAVKGSADGYSATPEAKEFLGLTGPLDDPSLEGFQQCFTAVIKVQTRLATVYSKRLVHVVST